MLQWARILARATWPQVLSLCFFPWLAVFFGVVQLDAVVDWHVARGIWGDLPATIGGSSGVLLAAAWLWSMGPLLRRALATSPIRWLPRAPLSARAGWAASAWMVLPMSAPLWLGLWVWGVHGTSVCAWLSTAWAGGGAHRWLLNSSHRI